MKRPSPALGTGPRRPDDDPWQQARWEGAEMETLLAGARMSLPEKLSWLEQMQRLAAHLAASRKRAAKS